MSTQRSAHKCLSIIYSIPAFETAWCPAASARIDRKREARPGSGVALSPEEEEALAGAWKPLDLEPIVLSRRARRKEHASRGSVK